MTKPYVIMNVGTEQTYRKPGHYCDASYATEAAAKAGVTRLNKKYGNEKQWVYMTWQEYRDKFDPMVAVYNHITGNGKTPVYIRRSEVGGVNDPSTERYHCM